MATISESNGIKGKILLYAKHTAQPYRNKTTVIFQLLLKLKNFLANTQVKHISQFKAV